jgi:hypothetical protein
MSHSFDLILAWLRSHQSILGLMNFPDKRNLICRLIGRSRVLRTINRWRAKAHKAPLEPPDGSADY